MYSLVTLLDISLFFPIQKIRVVNAFRHGMDSQHLQQATSNPNIQRVLQKQVSLSNKRLSVASSSYNTEAAAMAAAAATASPQAAYQQLQPQSLPPPQSQSPHQVSFQQPQAGIHVAPMVGAGAPIPPHVALQPAAATTRISIPEQSSYSHTETAV